MGQLNAFRGAMTVQGMLSLEGVTIERGELNAGMTGEGYIDRRHPHTYLHELTATAQAGSARTLVSVTAGKGFAPFGTDDPMTRPFEKYPINHHLAQILERIVVIAALRRGPVILEGGSFNGDEPESAGDAPNRRRLWDSWAARLTVIPLAGSELQASYARVESPENSRGGGPDDRKYSASARFTDRAQTRYALLEWARTGEYVSGSPTFSFTSLLAEGAVRNGDMRWAMRLERTERPDEERLSDPFRTVVPATDFSILGRSRWIILTGRIGLTRDVGANFRVEPFLEMAGMSVSETFTPSAFDPRLFYGSNRIWSLSFGARLSSGMIHSRMGRYGAAITPERGRNFPGRSLPPHQH